jgi:hypothetical protein
MFLFLDLFDDAGGAPVAEDLAHVDVFEQIDIAPGRVGHQVGLFAVCLFLTRDICFLNVDGVTV